MLVTVLAAVCHGALVLNHVEIKELKMTENLLSLLLTDHLSGCDIKMKSKHLVKLKLKEPSSKQKHVHCFKVPDLLLSKDTSYIFPSKGITLRKYFDGNIACLYDCDNQRHAFEKLKSLIKRHYVLRKGEVVSLPARKVEKSEFWEVTSESGTYKGKLSENPIIKKPLNSTTLLYGSHGWYPELSRVIHSKYGLNINECEDLVSIYGDFSETIARKMTKQNKLEAKTEFCVEELCATVQDVCIRLGVREREDVRRVATKMAQLLQWSRSFTEDQVVRTEKWLNETEKLELWKSEDKLREFNFSDKMKKQHQLFFKSKMGKDKKIKFYQIEEYLKSENFNLKQVINDELLESSLRSIDSNENGSLSEEEFFDLMQYLQIDTPEELIDNHINRLKISQK